MRILSGVCLLVSLWFMMSCSSSKVVKTTPQSEDIEEYTFDPIDIYPDSTEKDSILKVYRGTATMTYDIIHTKLDLRFDWTHSNVIGKANLVIKPYFKSIDSLRLDAVGFDINKISLTSGKPLSYRYDGVILTVMLDRTYTRKDTFRLNIEYVAKPDDNPVSGSEVITSNKGLFFVNPLGKDPDVPIQIWTQGETENNSRWFPTFDKPNERFSQEIIMTVDDKYRTLSNGKLISSKSNADGTRTDYWKQDKPHAPYLAMIAVGDFHVEQDQWNGIPLAYMVDKKYGKYAKQIFNHTPEMLTFFSNILNSPYPWDKFSQVAVHEFVSGAMENTGAVVFGDFVQKTDRELLEENNDEIVAHEMFHHWFGDLVTCEDWSNLVLNEGFANYAEYLWNEHKYGHDFAEYKRFMSIMEYYQEFYYGKIRPVVDYYYSDREDMFDRHSYNKGGLILHMLRTYLGDDAFFASLNKYLTRHAGSSVELAELRIAFEDTVGEDLNWFFDQWFLGKGQPHINVNYTYDSLNRSLLVHTDQSGTPDNFYHPFKIPTDVAIYYADGSITYHPIIITDTIQDFLIEHLKGTPVNYIFNSKADLLAIKKETKPESYYLYQFKHADNFTNKVEALQNLEQIDEIIPIALKDDFYFVRALGIDFIPDSLVDIYTERLQDMTLTDSSPVVRRTAYLKLLNDQNFDPMLLSHIVIKSEKAYSVLELALNIIGLNEPESFNQYFNQFKNEDSDYLVSTLVSLIPDDSPNYLNYLDVKAKTIEPKYIDDFYKVYHEYVSKQNTQVIERAINVNLEIANPSNGSQIRKAHAMNLLTQLGSLLLNMKDDIQAQSLLDNVLPKIKNIALTETDPELIDLPLYKGFRE